VWQSSCDQRERAPRIDVEHQVVPLERELADTLQRDRRGVVDEDVDPIEPLRRLSDRGVDRSLVADVPDDR
jgi:hypothetical protein